MGKSRGDTTPSKLKPINLCYDRILTGSQKILAAELAAKENRSNTPKVSKKLFGVSSHPLKMALQTGKRWRNGRILRVCFLDGSTIQKQRVREHAMHWMTFANIAFSFDVARSKSDIRISRRRPYALGFLQSLA